MRHFRIKIFVRLVVLSILLGFALHYFFIEERWLRGAYLTVFTLLALGELYWFIDRTNRNIANFLTSLMQNDFTTTFTSRGHDKSFRHLHESLNRVTDKFNELNATKEAHHLYLEALISHVSVGIISYDYDEKVMLINQAFREMTGRQSLSFLHGLDKVDRQLLTTIRALRPGESRLVSITLNNELLQLNIHKTEFRELENTYMLVSLHNIRRALNIHEIQAWKKLMRVLTHEIMNSVSPITSLSSTLQQLLEQPDYDHPTILQGLEAIRSRSAGLESFTKAYRQLTGIPVPVRKKILLIELMQRILPLFKSENSHVAFSCSGKKTASLNADPDLLGQVLINLIRNALDAISGQKSGRVEIAWKSLENGCQLLITDNGPGIDENKLDQIFIPFFTTKKNGSGIGLAVSQQIIQMHDGFIDVHSEPGRTSFRIWLPEG